MPIKPFPTRTPAGAAQPSPMAQVASDEAFIREQDAKRAAAQARQAPPASASSPVQQAAPAPRRAAPASYPSSYPDEGVGGNLQPDEGAGGGGGSLPYANTFSDLKAGAYDFLCCVEAIIHWTDGPVVMFRVRVGEDAGREFKWEQTPPPGLRANEKALPYWRRNLFEAYAAGGWTADANPETGWPGWPRSAANTGSLIPPYIDFFVTDVEGKSVPVMLHVRVLVEPGRERFPKIIAVQQHEVDGNLVQAPMPRKVTPWIAERHRWSGQRKDITVKPNDKNPQGAVIPSMAPDWDQFPRGIGGLLGLRDIA